MCEKKTLSILMPVFNEEKTLAQIIEQVLKAPIPPEVYKKELLIVDDGSTDKSADIIMETCREHPEIKAFTQFRNSGKGAAIRLAIQKMTGDFAIIQDADLEYDPSDYSLLLQPLIDGLADAVYGSRFAFQKLRRVLNCRHKFGNQLLTRLSNIVTGLDLTDMATGYKAFRADLLRSIPLRSNRFGIDAEITAKLARRRAVLYEVPVNYCARNYQAGKKIGWQDGVSAVWTIFKYAIVDDGEHRG